MLKVRQRSRRPRLHYFCAPLGRRSTCRFFLFCLYNIILYHQSHTHSEADGSIPSRVTLRSSGKGRPCNIDPVVKSPNLKPSQLSLRLYFVELSKLMCIKYKNGGMSVEGLWKAERQCTCLAVAWKEKNKHILDWPLAAELINLISHSRVWPFDFPV